MRTTRRLLGAGFVPCGFGAAANLPHFDAHPLGVAWERCAAEGRGAHILFLDGAFEAGPKGRPVFRPGPHVDDDDVGALVAAIAERLLATPPASDDALDEDEPLALFQAASIQDSSLLGDVRRMRRLGGRERTLPPLCAAIGGIICMPGVARRASRAGVTVRSVGSVPTRGVAPPGHSA